MIQLYNMDTKKGEYLHCGAESTDTSSQILYTVQHLLYLIEMEISTEKGCYTSKELVILFWFYLKRG